MEFPFKINIKLLFINHITFRNIHVFVIIIIIYNAKSGIDGSDGIDGIDGISTSLPKT
jgi:hypothetical protein